MIDPLLFCGPFLLLVHYSLCLCRLPVRPGGYMFDPAYVVVRSDTHHIRALRHEPLDLLGLLLPACSSVDICTVAADIDFDAADLLELFLLRLLPLDSDSLLTLGRLGYLYARQIRRKRDRSYCNGFRIAASAEPVGRKAL